jgi:hypothetical protein
MRIFRGRAAGTASNELATHAALHTHGAVTTVVSAAALLFSAYSMWETSLKQADVNLYVTGVVTYDRDASAAENIMPNGGFEVFAVPITIANSGARDAAILSLQVDAANQRTGLSARFEGEYTVDGTYFASAGDKRPKTPFSALVIPGRSAWTGTVLFYPVSYSSGKVLTPVAKVREFYDALREKYRDEMDKLNTSSLGTLRDKRPDLAGLAAELASGEEYEARLVNAGDKNTGDKVELTLRVDQPAPSGWLDRMLTTSVEPIAFTVNIPALNEHNMLRGEGGVRLRPAATGS